MGRLPLLVNSYIAGRQQEKAYQTQQTGLDSRFFMPEFMHASLNAHLSRKRELCKPA